MIRVVIPWYTMEKTPEITGELMQRQVPLIRKMTAESVKTAVEQTCQEAHCTADERQALTDMAARVAPAS